MQSRCIIRMKALAAHREILKVTQSESVKKVFKKVLPQKNIFLAVSFYDSISLLPNSLKCFPIKCQSFYACSVSGSLILASHTKLFKRSYRKDVPWLTSELVSYILNTSHL